MALRGPLPSSSKANTSRNGATLLTRNADDFALIDDSVAVQAG